MAAIFDLVLFTIFCPSFILYVLFLMTILKFRQKEPFNSPFYALLFSIGIIDIGHMLDSFLQFKLLNFGWGYDRVVMWAPKFFAKFHTVLNWYFAKGQIFGTFLLAANRFGSIALLRPWRDRESKAFIVACWFLPLLVNLPLWGQEFEFTQNGTDAAVRLSWKDGNFEWLYLRFCAVLCGFVSITCAFSYAYTFVITYQRKVRMSSQASRSELKLLILGFILTILTGACSFSCFVLAYGTNSSMFPVAMYLFAITADLLDYINPYCVLAFSSTFRKHFKAAIFCRDVNTVSPSNVNRTKMKTIPSARVSFVVSQANVSFVRPRMNDE